MTFTKQRKNVISLQNFWHITINSQHVANYVIICPLNVPTTDKISYLQIFSSGSVSHQGKQFHVRPRYCFLPSLKSQLTTLRVLWLPETVILHRQLMDAPLSLCFLVNKTSSKDHLHFQSPASLRSSACLVLTLSVPLWHTVQKLHQCTIL